MKVLAYIGLQSEGSADFQDLLDNLEIPKNTLWRYISSLRTQGSIDINRSDRAKDLKSIKKKQSRTPKFEKIVVETIREAEQLNKEFKELDINKLASVLSTHNTMRYSRVVG